MAVLLKHLVPDIVVSHHQEPPWEQWIFGTVLFADVSGFTVMSEALASLGVKGSEILTDILNRYFSDMIRIIHSSGGEVMKFGGDAILCFFPGEGSQNRTLRAACEMQNRMPAYQNIKTSVQRFSLSMKIGIASGEVLLSGVGSEKFRCDYVFAGEAVDLTADAEHCAVSGEIVLAGEAAPSCFRDFIIEPLKSGFSYIRQRNVGIKQNIEFLVQNQQHRNRTNESIRPYLIAEIREQVEQGFDRYIAALQPIVAVFFQFSGFSYTKDGYNKQRFDRFFRRIIKITHQYGGRLNRISMGDKGSTFFLLFGATGNVEQKEVRACLWALDVRTDIEKEFPEVSCKIGMNAGKVFAGLVGGSERYDYTVMGDTVNFAARLMQGAEAMTICISESIQSAGERFFHSNYLGKRKFKGKEFLLPVYELQRKKKRLDSDTSDEISYIGRKKEQDYLQGIIRDVFGGKTCGVLLKGEAGIGKSSLASHLMKQQQEAGWKIYKGYGSITRQGTAYAPWIEVLSGFLKDAFDGELNTDVMQHNLESRKYDTRSISALCEILFPEDTPESEMPDSETKKRLLHNSIIKVIQDVAGKVPKLFFFDDLHWFDSLSCELLSDVLGDVFELPILFLCTSRVLLEDTSLDRLDNYFVLELKELEQSDVINFCENYLDLKIHQKLQDFIIDHGQGNPFYTLSLLQYLQKKEHIDIILGQAFLKEKAISEETLSGEDIILSQLDSFTNEEKVHVLCASCIGPVFSLEILRHALGRNFRVRAWKAILNSDLIQHREEESYCFSQTLIQDTFYKSIAHRTRKHWHRRIAKALEQQKDTSLEHYYPNLANHYFLAGNRDKTVHYSMEAGLKLFNQQAYQEAKIYYERVWKLLYYTSNPIKWDAGINLVNMYISTRKFKEALILAKYITEKTKEYNIIDQYYKGLIHHFIAMFRLNDLSYIPKVEKLLQSEKKLPLKIVSKLKYLFASGLMRKGAANKAKGILEEIVNLPNSEETLKIKIEAYYLLIRVNHRMTEYQKGMENINAYFQLAQRDLDKAIEIGISILKANILMDSGDLSGALKLYHQTLEEAYLVSDKSIISSLILNIGCTYLDLGNYSESKKYLDEAIVQFNKIASIAGLSNALNYRGIISFYEKSYQESYDYYHHALELLRGTEQNDGQADLYYNLIEVCLKLNNIDEVVSYYKKLQMITIKSENSYFQELLKNCSRLVNSAIRGK